MNYGFFLQLVDGTKITILVAICSIIVGIFLGILGVSSELSKIGLFRNMSIMLSSIIRGVPELLVIFSVYFGGSIVIKDVLKINGGINSFVAGVLALGLIYGAYAIQVFKSAILMINQGQIEVSKAMGMSRLLIYKKILFPQIFSYALPGLSNLCLVTLKDSALVALIGLQDLTFKAQLIANESYQPFTYYALCGLIYMVLTSIFEIMFRVVHNRKKYGF